MEQFKQCEQWWRMLQDPEATESVDKANAALCRFAVELNRYCRTETVLAERSQSLTFAKGVLSAPHEWTHEGEEAEKLTLYISGIAVELIEGELKILKMELAYPDQFNEVPGANPPLVRWGGSIADLVEYHIGPQAAGVLQLPTGKPMTWEETVDFLEKTYGVTISNPSDRRAKVLDRQKNTTFQDKMRQVYSLESDRKSK